MADLEITKVNEKEITSQEELSQILADPSTNKPSDEDKKKFQEEFEKAAVEFQNKKWIIAGSKDAFKTLEYINDFIKNKAYWNNNVWMGLIKMNELIEEMYKNLKDGDELGVEYQPLEFLAYIFQNGVNGIGLQSALEFEKVAAVHATISDNILKPLKEARELIKEIQFKQEQWMAAEQGFFLVKEDGVEKPENSTQA